MSPKVTVTLGTSRPGGLDVSLLGLAAQTYTDWELVLVDARYHQRHAQVLDAVAASGLKVPVYHVPNHRVGTGPWTTICAGYNTGFALAAGELVVFLCDYAYVRPDWLEKHVAAHTQPRMVCAPHQYRGLPKMLGEGRVVMPAHVGMPADKAQARRDFFATIGEISIFERTPTPEEIEALPLWGIEDSDGKHGLNSGPIAPHYMHTKNESFPLEHVLAIGGMDENYDRGRGPGDPDLGRRLVASGLQSWLCREAGVLVLNPRDIMPNPNIALQDEDLGERWGCKMGNAYFKATEGRTVANNPFDIRKKREELWKWRDWSQDRDFCIESDVVGDADYFASCPVRWP
jgi:glycosyltransferase involved in cell wall biosynthesis